MGIAELRAAVALRQHRPRARVLIDGRQIEGTTGTIDYGYDAIVATASITLKTRPSWLQFGQPVEIWLGWNGEITRRFVGFLEDDGRKAWPHTKTIKAAGYMRKAERKSPVEVVYTNTTARVIVADLLSKAGITNTDVQGDDTNMGYEADVIIRKGQSYVDLINAIDEPFLCKTFDWMPDGRVCRRSILGLPCAGSVWTYTYPGNVLEIDNPTTVRNLRNRVEVTGLDDVSVSRRADSPYVESGYDEVCEVRSDYIETEAIAGDVALITMPVVNRITRQVTIKVAGNPLLHPGDTITLNAATVGITSENLWLKHLNDAWTENSYYSMLTLEGGQGEAGYELPKPPVPSFTMNVVRERFSVGGTLGTYYIVQCDASGTTDPDSDSSTLTYAWANNKTADVGSAIRYALRLTQAEIDAAATITLTVGDGTNTETLTLDVPDSTDPMLTTENLYSAESAQASCTPDGGVTWNTAAIAATCTPEIAGEDHSYFGVGAALYHTADWLATAPTLVHTFGATINCIWICESDADKVAVGLANGQYWYTANASALAGATWTNLWVFATTINWVGISYTGTEHWACMGSQVILNGAVQWQHSAGYTAKRLALSFYSHYSAADNGSAVEVKRNDGVALTFSGGTPTVVGGLTHHVLDDVLYFVDRPTADVYATAAGSTVLTKLSTIGGGVCNHIIRDGNNPSIFYAACADGIYKSYDECVTWYLMRDLTGAGLDGLMIGYGSAPWTGVTPVTVVSAAGEGKVLTLGVEPVVEPANWRGTSFDDSGWLSPVLVTPADSAVPGSQWIGEVDENRPKGEILLHRIGFSLDDGVVASAILSMEFDNWLSGLWLNGVWLYATPAETHENYGYPTPVQITIPTNILQPGNNVLAFKVKNSTLYEPPFFAGWHHGEMCVAYKLEIA